MLEPRVHVVFRIVNLTHRLQAADCLGCHEAFAPTYSKSILSETDLTFIKSQWTRSHLNTTWLSSEQVNNSPRHADIQAFNVTKSNIQLGLTECVLSGQVLSLLHVVISPDRKIVFSVSRA